MQLYYEYFWILYDIFHFYYCYNTCIFHDDEWHILVICQVMELNNLIRTAHSDSPLYKLPPVVDPSNEIAEVLVKSTSTIPNKYAARQGRDFEFGCADGPGQGIGTHSLRGSHVYEINAWLWNFGRPQPRVDGLSVAKTEKIRSKVKSAASRRKARKLAAQADADIWHESSWHIPVIYLWSLNIHDIYLSYTSSHWNILRLTSSDAACLGYVFAMLGQKSGSCFIVCLTWKKHKQ